jgi:hypothetical protein
MKELSPRAQALLKRAGPAGAPAAGAQARVHRALQSRIAEGVALGASGGVLKAAWAASGLKVLGVVSVIGATAATWQAYQAPSSTSSQAVPAAPAAMKPRLDSEGGGAGEAGVGERPEGTSSAAQAPRAAPPVAERVPGTNERRPATLRPREERRADSDVAAANSAPSVAPLSGASQGAPASLTQNAPDSARRSAAARPEPIAERSAVLEHGAALERSAALAGPGESRPPVALNPSLTEETEALRAVQRAIRDGKSEHALQLLNEDDVRFTRGGFAQERSAARVLALCKLARVELARAEAERFLQRWPRSPLLGRVQAACR